MTFQGDTILGKPKLALLEIYIAEKGLYCDPQGCYDYCVIKIIKETIMELEQNEQRCIPKWLYDRLNKLGVIPNDTRNHNVGKSNYSKHVLQPWSIWLDWNLNPWDADILKRLLRTKDTDPRRMDYEKIIHICQERIRQIDCGDETA